MQLNLGSKPSFVYSNLKHLEFGTIYQEFGQFSELLRNLLVIISAC